MMVLFKNFKTVMLAAIAAAALSSCGGHFISDRNYRQTVMEDFESRNRQFSNAGLGDALHGADRQKKEAMAFLYAYMPLSDIANYSPEYFGRQVEYAFRARREMAWGKDVPESLFRHFVLPPRVNNESLDEFRSTCYEELKDRVAGLSIYDAALEVNRWCHERVTYAPSDSRTSAPLASIRTATGRCGEESVLAVAAMRTVGIPARQVYTPRWAHTDDNHAWVEVWADGKWYFLGACEPAPALNMAWFNEPASRAMLMHTNVFGKYYGNADIIKRTPCNTEINVIENYVPVRRNSVTVTDTDGNPVRDATVEFKIYNYGEFYPVVRLKSDEDGCVELTTGKGDMLVWASSGDRFGYGILSGDSLTVTLGHAVGERISEDIDIVPPVQGKIPYEVTEEAVKANEILLAREDSIRNAYTDTFPDIKEALAICRKYGLAPECAEFLTASCGNHAAVTEFLKLSATRMKDATELLKTLSAKDLRDVPMDVLCSHLQESPLYGECDGNIPEDIYYEYVLAPRISNESLTPYKAELAAAEELEGLSPEDLADWCDENIIPADEVNQYTIPLSPCGVLKLKAADSHSRDIFFVAVCRSKGIPARIDSVTGKVQFYTGNRWNDVYRADVDAEAHGSGTGCVSALYSPIPSVPDPEYYRHFTISKFDGNVFRALNFEEGDATELGAEVSWKSLLGKPYKTDSGYYQLCTGTRMASGKVLAHIELFPVENDRKSEIPMILRHDEEDVQVIGHINAETPVLNLGGELSTILSVTGRGYFMLVLPGVGDEPSSHAMREISGIRHELEAWGRKIVIALPEGTATDGFPIEKFGDMPDNLIVIGEDNGNSIRKMVLDGCKKEKGSLPVIAIADTFGRVVYLSTGYNTSLGSRIAYITDRL